MRELAYNLGNGEGYSVEEVIKAVRRVTKLPVSMQDAPRRAGNPARLVADSQHARTELNWRTRYFDLDAIVQHAWYWEMKKSSATNTGAVPAI